MHQALLTQPVLSYVYDYDHGMLDKPLPLQLSLQPSPQLSLESQFFSFKFGSATKY